jgi:hypothetical protein
MVASSPFILVWAAAAAGAASAASAASPAAILEAAVDASPTSPAASFSLAAWGFDNGPLCDTGPSYAPAALSTGGTLIRTHDMEVLDWWSFFPNGSDPLVDPDDAANYDWSSADAAMRNILDAGLKPYFRMGTSWTSPPWSVAPRNVTQFARTCVRAVMHYNEGWGGGNFSGRNIEVVEIWNEPDGVPRFWNLTAEDFYVLFDATVRALKAYDPSLVVGGPALANSAPISKDYGLDLMAYIAEHNTPIDFFSFHRYGWPWATNGTGYRAIARGVRDALTAAGLSPTLPMHLTEWNIGVLTDVADMPQAATFVADVLASLLQEGVALSIFYPGCSGGWGLWDEGMPGAPHWRPMANAHLAVGSTIRDFPQSLLAGSSASYPGGTPTVVAGASADGAGVSVVVSADGTAEGVAAAAAAAPAAAAAVATTTDVDGSPPPPPPFTLANVTVTGLAPGSRYNYTLRLINGTTTGPNATAWACNYCVVAEGTALVPGSEEGDGGLQGGGVGATASATAGGGGSLTFTQAATPPVVLHLTLQRQQ